MKMKFNSRRFKLIFFVIIFSTLMAGCKKRLSIDDHFDFCTAQYSFLVLKAIDIERIPRTVEKSTDEIQWTNQKLDWTEGFFPGTLWLLYEQSGDKTWEQHARVFQSHFIDHRWDTTLHDLGFIFNCSYGNGYRLTKDKKFKGILVDAANSLIKRFDQRIGCIKSWDTYGPHDGDTIWQYPVIIDNMMNLELLFEAALLTRDSSYYQMAVSHADKTLENHFRDDHSSFHVVDYDSITGIVRGKYTAQGHADTSSWARGQAWGLYGYTLSYRYTNDEDYLDQAIKIADFIFGHQHTPDDLIPYWDYDDPSIPEAPRDASAAAIIASSLLELSQFTNDEKYIAFAEKILLSLSNNTYRGSLGKNNGFILKNSVGSIPHNREISVPINYADYYYVEALIRLKNMYNTQKSI